MSSERGREAPGVVVEPGQPLVGLIIDQDGHEVVRYFAEPHDHPITSPDDLRAALSVIGAWADLDWEEALAELDRIRQESAPTPPIEL